MEKKEDKGISQKAAAIKEFGNTYVNDMQEDESIKVLTIIGQIEGHQNLPPQTKSTKYEHVIPELISMEQNPKVQGLLIILNTVGGDIEAGLAIAEMINSMSKPTVSLVIGGSHSIGVPLATSSHFSFISPSATMILDPISLNGLVIGAPQTFEYFNKMQERINDFIVRTSKIDKEALRQLLLQTDELLNDMGTILIGDQAVSYGLINEVGGVKESLRKLKELISNNKP